MHYLLNFFGFLRRHHQCNDKKAFKVSDNLQGFAYKNWTEEASLLRMILSKTICLFMQKESGNF